MCFVLLFGFSFFVPTAKATSPSLHSLLQGKTMYLGTTNSSQDALALAVTDASLTTHSTIKGPAGWSYPNFIWMDFEMPKSIDAYTLKADYASNLQLSFYDSAGLKISTIPTLAIDGSIVSIPTVNNVKKISLENTSHSNNMKIFSLDAFTADLSDITGPHNITNFSETHNYHSFSLSWTNPSDPDFHHVAIYRDGFRLGQSTNGSFSESWLTNNKAYKYTLYAVDNHGNESSGFNITLNSDSLYPLMNNAPMTLATCPTCAGTSYNTATDGKDNTYVIVKAPNGWNYPNHLWYDFDTPVSIFGYKNFNNGSAKSYLQLIFYNIEGNVIHKITKVEDSRTIISIPEIKNVKKVAIYNTTNTLDIRVFDFNLYAFDITPPSKPIGVSAEPLDGSVELNWNPVQDVDLKEYQIYQDNVLIKSVPKNETSQSITGLSNGTSYTFEISSTDIYGNESARSNPVSVTPNIPDTTPPGEVSNLLSVEKKDAIEFTWNNPIDFDFKQVNIYRDGVPVGFSVNGHFTDPNIQSEKTYRYEFISVDKSNNISTPVEKVLKTNDYISPGEVKNLSLTEWKTHISLSWVNPGDADFSGVYIYRNGKLIGTTSSQIFEDHNLVPGETYIYVLKTFDLAKNISTGVSITYKNLDKTAPEPPKGLQSILKDKNAMLSWLKNKESDLIGYRLYENNVLIAKFDKDITQTEIMNLIKNKIYSYALTAVDFSGNESSKSFFDPLQLENSNNISNNSDSNSNSSNNNVSSNSDSSNNNVSSNSNSNNGNSNGNSSSSSNNIEKPFLEATTSNEKISLKWTHDANPLINGYYIYQNGDKIATLSIDDNQFEIEELKNGEEYRFVLVSYDKNGDTSNTSNTVVATPNLESPNKITVIQKDDTAIITWEKPKVDEISGYYIYQDDKLIDTVYSSTSSYEIKNLDVGKKYRFSVASFNSKGHTSQVVSQSVSVSPELIEHHFDRVVYVGIFFFLTFILWFILYKREEKKKKKAN